MNKYELRMKKEDFFQSTKNITASNIIVDGGQVTFKTNEISKFYFDQNNIDYELVETNGKKIRKKFKYHRPFLFGLILLISVIYINNYRISEIKFNEDTPINVNIETEILNKSRTLFFWTFCSIDYNEYAKNLRSEYPIYPWISVTKKGSVINVKIEEYDDQRMDITKEPLGNIIATKDSIIHSYQIYSGQNNLTLNKYVKKGDILISSCLSSNNNVYVTAKGIVLGEVFEEYNIIVNKKNTENIQTGRTTDYFQVNLFGNLFDFSKSNDFQNANIKETTKFNFFDIFSINKIIEKEKCDIIKPYTKKEAEEYAISLIEKNFTENTISNLEKIKNIEVLNVIENDESYTVKVLTKKIESIGKFVSLDE